MSRWTNSASGRRCHHDWPVRPCSQRGPFVPVGVLRILLAPLIEQDGLGGVAERASLSPRALYRIMTGESARASFDLAERIVVEVFDDPSLWWTVPELAAAYAKLAAAA